MKKGFDAGRIFFLFVFVLALVPGLVNWLFSWKLIKTPWCASDALAYVGSALSCLGTVILGTIAWKQNNELGKIQEQSFRIQERGFDIEERSFASNNSCIAVVTKLLFFPLSYSSLRLQSNPIVCEDGVDENEYGSFSVEISMKRIENCASIVRVTHLLLSLCNEKENILINTHPYDNFYSRIAISEEGYFLNIIVMTTPKNSEKIIDLFNKRNPLFLVINMELIMSNYVATEIECHSTFEYSGIEKGQNCWVGSNLLVFWRGRRALAEESVFFRYEHE